MSGDGDGYIHNMRPTLSGDAPSPATDTPKLRVDKIDALMKAKGVKSVAAQARRFAINRQHWFDLRAGRSVPSLPTALRIAAEVGTSVEEIWGAR